MKIFSKSIIYALLFTLFSALTIRTVKAQEGFKWQTDDSGGTQTKAYLNAAKAFRNAAGKTKCEARRAFYIKNAECLEYNAQQIKSGGTLKTCNFGEAPACSADAPGADSDALGADDDNGAGDTGGQVSPYTQYLQQQVQTNNAVDAGFNALQSHMDNGGKASGGILRGALMAASQVSDPSAGLSILGIGGGLALLTKAGEANKERQEVERLEKEKAMAAQREADMEVQRERERQRLVAIEKKKLRTARLSLITNQFNQLLPASASEKMPTSSMNLATREIYYLLFRKEQQQHDVFTALNVWLANTPITIHRNADNTWPFTVDIKRGIVQKLHEEDRAERDIQLLGPFSDRSEAIRIRDEIVARARTLDAINLHLFLVDSLTFGGEKKIMTDFWDNKTPVTKAGQSAKSAPTAKSFWDN